jgi:hypothetical protein
MAQAWHVRTGFLDDGHVGLVGDQGDRPGVAEQFRRLRGRQAGVQRHMGESCFHRSRERFDRLVRVVHQHSYPFARFHPEFQ